MSAEAALEVIRRAVWDPPFRDHLRPDVDQALADQGVATPEERAELTEVLHLLFAGLESQTSEVELRQKQLRTTSETADAFKQGLQKTLEQIDRGFRLTMLMYQVAFYLGIGLVVFAVALAATRRQALFPVAFAGLGVADIVAYFITKPPLDLQRSRARLAQLQATFYNWFFDLTNWHGFLIESERSGELTPERVKMISSALADQTERTVKIISQYIAGPTKES